MKPSSGILASSVPPSRSTCPLRARKTNARTAAGSSVDRLGEAFGSLPRVQAGGSSGNGALSRRIAAPSGGISAADKTTVGRVSPAARATRSSAALVSLKPRASHDRVLSQATSQCPNVR